MRIGEAAQLAGVSIRTLQYYDRIGLLKPTTITETGYRLYSSADLQRLQQILLFKEMGFSLAEIKDLLICSHGQRKDSLRAQKEVLQAQLRRLTRIIHLVDETIKELEEGAEMKPQDMFGPFSEEEVAKHREKYAQEAREKYGHTQAYQESEKRAARYTKEQWAQAASEADGIYKELAQLIDRDPAADQVQTAIEKWHQHICRWYYDCSLEIFRGLGNLYVEDPRFTENIDKYRPGLAAFMQKAMEIYCQRRQG
ncbi:MAG: MerR family transcriptional regulator [Limnochordia bacterium]